MGGTRVKTAKQITETYKARFHESWEYYHLKVNYNIVKNEETGDTEYNQTGYSEGYVNFSESYYSTETIVKKAAQIAVANREKISNYGSAPDDYDLPSFTMTNRTGREYQKTIVSKTFSTGKVTEKVTTTPITSQLMVRLNKCGGTETLNDMARSIKTLQKKFGLPQTGTMNGMVAKQLSNLGKGTLSKKTGGTDAISPTVFAGLGITIAPPISTGFEGSTSTVLTEIIGTTIGAAKIAAPVGVFLYILLTPTTTAGVPEDVERVRIQAHINRQNIDKIVAGMPTKWPGSALPSEGDFPFSTPIDKSGNPVVKKDRSTGGFIDKDGNVWNRDHGGEKVGNPHWDVTLKDGGHLNVNGDDVENPGKIQHGERKTKKNEKK